MWWVVHLPLLGHKAKPHQTSPYLSLPSQAFFLGVVKEIYNKNLTLCIHPKISPLVLCVVKNTGGCAVNGKGCAVNAKGCAVNERGCAYNSSLFIYILLLLLLGHSFPQATFLSLLKVFGAWRFLTRPRDPVLFFAGFCFVVSALLSFHYLAMRYPQSSSIRGPCLQGKDSTTPKAWTQ